MLHGILNMNQITNHLMKNDINTNKKLKKTNKNKNKKTKK